MQKAHTGLDPLELLAGPEPPWPSTMRKVVTAVELPVTLEEFFGTCWSDAAQLSFTKAVHEARGDSEVHVTNWTGNKPAGFVRDLTFRSPIKGMSLGCGPSPSIRGLAGRQSLA